MYKTFCFLSLVLGIWGQSMYIDIDNDFDSTSCQLYQKNQEIFRNFTISVGELRYVEINLVSNQNTTIEMDVFFVKDALIYTMSFTCFSENKESLEILCKSKIRQYLYLPKRENILFWAKTYCENCKEIVINYCSDETNEGSNLSVVATVFVILGAISCGVGFLLLLIRDIRSWPPRE